MISTGSATPYRKERALVFSNFFGTPFIRAPTRINQSDQIRYGNKWGRDVSQGVSHAPYLGAGPQRPKIFGTP